MLLCLLPLLIGCLEQIKFQNNFGKSQQYAENEVNGLCIVHF